MSEDPGNLKLWNKYKNEKNPEVRSQLRNKLVELYYPFVQKISYKMAERLGWNLTPEELSSFGVDGLYIAIERFDLSRGIKFESYANIRVQGSMLDGVRREDLIPRSVRMNNSKFEKIRLKLESEKNRRITDIEIVEELKIDQTEYIRNPRKYSPVTFCSLDSSNMVDDKNEDCIKKDQNFALADSSTSTPDSKIRRKEFFNKLLGKNFNKTEQKVVYLYYWEDMTMETIAGKLKLSESRVSQIHKLLLPRLKEKIIRNPNFFGKDVYEFIDNCNDKSSLY